MHVSAEVGRTSLLRTLLENNAPCWVLDAAWHQVPRQQPLLIPLLLTQRPSRHPLTGPVSMVTAMRCSVFWSGAPTSTQPTSTARYVALRCTAAECLPCVVLLDCMHALDSPCSTQMARQTPAHQASMNGHCGALRCLAEHKADLSRADGKGEVGLVRCLWLQPVSGLLSSVCLCVA